MIECPTMVRWFDIRRAIIEVFEPYRIFEGSVTLYKIQEILRTSQQVASQSKQMLSYKLPAKKAKIQTVGTNESLPISIEISAIDKAT